jgi:hypothetical protein
MNLRRLRLIIRKEHLKGRFEDGACAPLYVQSSGVVVYCRNPSDEQVPFEPVLYFLPHHTQSAIETPDCTMSSTGQSTSKPCIPPTHLARLFSDHIRDKVVEGTAIKTLPDPDFDPGDATCHWCDQGGMTDQPVECYTFVESGSARYSTSKLGHLPFQAQPPVCMMTAHETCMAYRTNQDGIASRLVQGKLFNVFSAHAKAANISKHSMTVFLWPRPRPELVSRSLRHGTAQLVAASMMQDLKHL